jgi:hypothetical protein
VSLGKRGSDCEGNNYIVSILGGAVGQISMCFDDAEGYVYIADNPEEPGVRCLRIELSLSPAILKRIDVCGCE